MKKDWIVASGLDIFHLSKERCSTGNQPSDFPCVELDCLSQGTGEIINTINISKVKGVRNRFTKGQVLYGKLRPYLNKYARPLFDGACSTEIWVIDTKDKTKLLQEYLFYLVQSVQFRDAASATSGTKMPRASWEIIKSASFDLPPIAEQEQIAEILSDADVAIALAEKLLEKEKINSRASIKILLRAVSGKTIPLGKAVDFQKGKAVKLNPNGKGLPYIGSKSFEGEFFAFTNDSAGIPCKETDVLLLWDGDAGKATTGLSGIVGSTVARLRPKPPNKNYFLFGVLSESLERIRLMREGSAIMHLPRNFLEMFEIPLVSESKQSKIASLIIAQQKKQACIESLIAALKKQKRGLMQQLLTGKLRVNSKNKAKKKS